MNHLRTFLVTRCPYPCEGGDSVHSHFNSTLLPVSSCLLLIEMPGTVVMLDDGKCLSFQLEKDRSKCQNCVMCCCMNVSFCNGRPARICTDTATAKRPQSTPFCNSQLHRTCSVKLFDCCSSQTMSCADILMLFGMLLLLLLCYSCFICCFVLLRVLFLLLLLS